MNYIQNLNGDKWLTEDDRDNLKISYRIKDILFSGTSKFQDVMIVDSYDFGHMLVLDGVVQTTASDGFVYNEMISHIPINYHPNPKNVLVIGGGDCGAAREVAKYPNIENIDMVEIDELVVTSCKEHLQEISGNLSDPRVNFIFDDGVNFVASKKNTYDVIIVDSSDPIGPAEVLFELDFYKNIHAALKEDGVMVCQSQSPIFHFDILNQTYSRISSLFPITKLYTATVPTYPGGAWSFTLGSKVYDKVVDTEFDKETKYVNSDILTGCFKLPEYIKSKLTK